MQELEINELKSIDGGADIGFTGLALISIGIPFVVGIIDGFVRPLACN